MQSHLAQSDVGAASGRALTPGVGGGCQVLLVKWGGNRVDGTKGGAVAGPRGGVSGVLRAGARLSGDHVCGFWEPGGLTVQRGAAG